MAALIENLKVRPYGNVEDIAKLVNEGKLAEAQKLLDYIIDTCAESQKLLENLKQGKDD